LFKFQSEVKNMIDELRKRFGSSFHPLSDFSMRFDDMIVSLEYHLQSRPQPAVFRLHPSDDGFFVWPDERSGKMYLLAQNTLIMNYNNAVSAWEKNTSEARRRASEIRPKIDKLQKQIEELETQVGDVAELRTRTALAQLGSLSSELAQCEREMSDPKPRRVSVDDAVARFFQAGLYIGIDDVIEAAREHRKFLLGYLGALPESPRKAQVTLKKGHSGPIGTGLLTGSLDFVIDDLPLKINVEFLKK